MNLQLYYQTIRDLEGTITEEFPLVVSLDATDGSKGGTKTEVPRRLAAKLLAEGLARLATAEEAQAYRDQLAEIRRAAERAAAADRLQVTVLSTTELDRLRSEARSTRE